LLLLGGWQVRPVAEVEAVVRLFEAVEERLLGDAAGGVDEVAAGVDERPVSTVGEAGLDQGA
jgi:hypothetical protein